MQCTSPCASCTLNPNYCLSCVAGYAIDGFSCFSTKQIGCSMTFNYPTVFNAGDSQPVIYGKMMFGFINFRSLLCGRLPFRMRKNDLNCRRNLKCRRFRFGSITVDLGVDASDYSSGAEAQDDMNAITVPGLTQLSVSSTADGFTDSTTSSTNLGLILGVSIPLGILLIIIIAIIVYSNKVDDEGTGGFNMYETNK